MIKNWKYHQGEIIILIYLQYIVVFIEESSKKSSMFLKIVILPM